MMTEHKDAPLPSLSFSDEEIESAGWRWTDGWMSLVPSHHTLADAQALLGPACGQSELANGVTYDFLDGLIRITLLQDDPAIKKIWLSGEIENADMMPAAMSQARARYGNFRVTRVEPAGGAIYERPGMRICCDPSGSAEQIHWMEIFRPLHRQDP